MNEISEILNNDNNMDTKAFVFPEGNGGMDAASLMALANNSGFGGNSWMWIFFLFFLFPLLGGGYGNGMGGNGFLSNQINNQAGRDLLMQAITGNTSAINSLASMFGTKSDNILQAVNTLTAQMGTMNADIRLDTCQQTNSINNNLNAGIQSLKDGNALGFNSVISKLDQIEDARKDREINALQAELATLKSEQYLTSSLAPIISQINDIKRCQAPTITVPNNQYAVVPYWAANGISDFLASAIANRVQGLVPSTSTTTPETGA
jgi:hypothetical protein